VLLPNETRRFNCSEIKTALAQGATVIQSFKSFLRVRSSHFAVAGALAGAVAGAIGTAGCSASPEASPSRAETIAHSAAAETAALWTAAYVGDAHAGSVYRRSNIQAKVALVLASDGTYLHVVLHVCGAGGTLVSDTKWFHGYVAIPASGNIGDLGGVTLTHPDGSSAYVNMSGPGTITLNGSTLNWIASYVGDGSNYGLYRYVYDNGFATDGTPLAGAIIGVIQWNGGSQGAVLFANGPVRQVDPLSKTLVPDAGDPSSLSVTFSTAPAPITIEPVDPIALTPVAL
jgi:hypothetical protein